MRQDKDRLLDAALLGFFVASGFCGLLYQIIWARLAQAAFGAITPILSVVISMFMLGLALGSWIGGRLADRLGPPRRSTALGLYALAELGIGVGGLVVPSLFRAGQTWLLPAGAFGSFEYLLKSGIVLGLSLFPWCLFMGTTFPLMMKFIKQIHRERSSGFSFLYAANVIGALAGTIITAVVLIERLGMRGSLILAAAVNGSIAAAALVLNALVLGRARAEAVAPVEGSGALAFPGEPIRPAAAFALLFMTGFASMGMEVAWTRAYTPVLRTTTYAFAGVLAAYLLATWLGARLYRRDLREGRTRGFAALLAALAVFSLLPIAAADPRLTALDSVLVIELVLLSLAPFCAALGYLTPKLIDAVSLGQPAAAGRAYAVNAAGCILGPLAAGYLMLPALDVRITLILLALPFAAAFALAGRALGRRRPGLAVGAGALTVVLLAAAAAVFRSYEDPRVFPGGVVRRDATASIISTGQGLEKRLLVNGISMTVLTPITKCMVHVPLGIRGRKPESALVVCVGMGTSFRSAASWGIPVTGVELVPGVASAFGYYFEDARRVMHYPRNRFVIDDGRRFLRRETELYDLISVDPPPPIEASGASVLYSQEFYRAARLRLKPDGILQQWVANWDEPTLTAVVKALRAEFPHVRAFHSMINWGIHFFASAAPFEMPSPEVFASRLPPKAARDLLEWNRNRTAADIYASILGNEVILDGYLRSDLAPALTDDRPINEYFLLRRLKIRGDIFSKRGER